MATRMEVCCLVQTHATGSSLAVIVRTHRMPLAMTMWMEVLSLMAIMTPLKFLIDCDYILVSLVRYFHGGILVWYNDRLVLKKCC